MNDEGFDRPFRFIVTGRYLAVHYHDGHFELRRDYHARGTLFYLSDDGEQIIHGRTYVGVLAEHPDYPGDVFYIRHGSQYLAPDGRRTDSVDDAVIVQLDPQSDGSDADLALPPPPSHPILDAENPISADGIDLFLPDKWFSLYPITGDCLWLGDAGEFHDMLYFGGNPYSLGMGFQLSRPEGNIRICSTEGRYLSVTMDAEVAEYLDESCRQHTWRDQCSRCSECYSLGFSSEPQECLSLVPTGLPSMFVFYDGVYYYQVSALKGSFATVVRVESMDAATVFQFVA